MKEGMTLAVVTIGFRLYRNVSNKLEHYEIVWYATNGGYLKSLSLISFETVLVSPIRLPKSWLYERIAG